LFFVGVTLSKCIRLSDFRANPNPKLITMDVKKNAEVEIKKKRFLHL